MPRILAIDPGTAKCGLAVVDGFEPEPPYHAIVPRSAFAATMRDVLRRFSPDVILLGDGTARAELERIVGEFGRSAVVVDEHGTTLAARERYFTANPPRGWRRLLPPGLRLPPGPIDDWAAVVIAERFLRIEGAK